MVKERKSREQVNDLRKRLATLRTEASAFRDKENKLSEKEEEAVHEELTSRINAIIKELVSRINAIVKEKEAADKEAKY